jgi:hypothetical protein
VPPVPASAGKPAVSFSLKTTSPLVLGGCTPVLSTEFLNAWKLNPSETRVPAPVPFEELSMRLVTTRYHHSSPRGAILVVLFHVYIGIAPGKSSPQSHRRESLRAFSPLCLKIGTSSTRSMRFLNGVDSSALSNRSGLSRFEAHATRTEWRPPSATAASFEDNIFICVKSQIPTHGAIGNLKPHLPCLRTEVSSSATTGKSDHPRGPVRIFTDTQA